MKTTLHDVMSFDTPRSLPLLTAPAKRPAVVEDFVLTERLQAGEPAVAAFQRLAASLRARRAEILSLMVYASAPVRREVAQAMQQAFGGVHWPVTWIESPTCCGRAIAGVQAFAVTGAAVTRVQLGAQVVGSVFEDADARHCLLGGLGPTSIALEAPAQTQQTLANLEWALEAAGFALGDVMRTWFYNDEIVAWYPAFNRVRTTHYGRVVWRTGSLPASTGIGVRNPAGAALTAAAWAVQPLDRGSCAQEIASPLQCPAPAYGSSFSRAMELTSGSSRRLFISGTASIHPNGDTAFVGNPLKQIDLTMEVVGAILQSRGMSFRDITRATAYFEHPLFKAYFDAWCATRELRDMPVVSTHCDICRADLLFEIEVDACVSAARGNDARPKFAQDSTTGA